MLPARALEDVVADVKSPTLLISAAGSEERDFNVLYEQAAHGAVEHWNLPGAQHTEAIRRVPGRVRAARGRPLQRGAALSTPASASFSRR